MMDWLLAPIDMARPHDVSITMSWHARTMVAAWAVLVPLGILSARYLKVTPGQDWPRELDNRTWWTLHRMFHYPAGLLMLVGLVLAIVRPDVIASLTGQAWVHRGLGWILLGLACVQFLSAVLRGTKGGPTSSAADGSLRGDHFDMTPRRIIFEWVHKTSGRLALVLTVPVILSGLWQLNAPHWMWLVIALWWGVLSLVAAVLELRFGTHDTYQAIWGPDPDLPGNRNRRDAGPA
jgi:hypothetical protein